MNPLGAVSKLAAKPSDAKIRITRIVFALILILTIVFGFNGTEVNFSFFDIKIADIPYDEYILPVLFIFPLVGLIRGIFDPGLFKKSIWKQIIIFLGGLMMIFSVFFLSEKPYIAETTTTTTGEVTAETLARTETDNGAMFAVMPTDNLFFFYGLLTLFVGFFLNNKNLTRKNEKHGEVIKKIRV